MNTLVLHANARMNSDGTVEDVPPPSPQVAGFGAVVEFIAAKLSDAEKALKARQEAEATWRGGTTASWRRAGCPLTKEQRLKVATKEGRIAAKCQREVDLFRATLSALQAPNNPPDHAAGCGPGKG